MDNNYNNDGFTPNPQNNDAPSPYRQNNQTDYSAQFAQYNQSRNVTEGQPEPPAQPDYTTTYQSEQPDQPAQPGAQTACEFDPHRYTHLNTTLVAAPASVQVTSTQAHSPPGFT